MPEKPSQPNSPGDLHRLLCSLGPTVRDLLDGYAIPPEDGSLIFREAMEVLLCHGERTSRPRQFFLRTLEHSCETWAAARAAEEETDDPSPGA